MQNDKGARQAPRAGELQDADPASAGQEAAADSGDALAAARAEAEQYKDQFLRARAELDNLRKRAERDLEGARKFALERFAGELLAVRDSLEMGLAAAEEQGGDLEKLQEGAALTARMLAQAMEKFGVEVVNPAGEAFNPDYQEAVSVQESSEHAPNTVTVVMQKGYLLNGRVLRPAMVVVSKAPGGGQAAS